MISKSHTHKMRLLEAFKRDENLTARIAADKYKVDTFSQRIKDIERMGYVVNRAWVYDASGRKSHMTYWIGQDQFKDAA